MGLFGMNKELKELKRKADAGDPEAQYRLADEYQGGKSHHLKSDWKKVVYYSEKAAEQGHLAAQDLLAFCYYYGRGGVEKDLEKAKYWKRKGAEQGDVRAQCGLAFYYEANAAGLADYQEAFKWYLRAANQDAAHAQYKVASSYFEGLGVDRNIDLAFEWAQKAAPGLEREAAEAEGDEFSFQFHTEQVRKNRELIGRCREEFVFLQDPVYQQLLLAIKRTAEIPAGPLHLTLSENEIAPSLDLWNLFYLRDGDPFQYFSAQLQELLGVSLSREDVKALVTVEAIYGELCVLGAVPNF